MRWNGRILQYEKRARLYDRFAIWFRQRVYFRHNFLTAEYNTKNFVSFDSPSNFLQSSCITSWNCCENQPLWSNKHSFNSSQLVNLMQFDLNQMKVNSPKFDFIRADKSNEIKSINQSINQRRINQNKLRFCGRVWKKIAFRQGRSIWISSGTSAPSIRRWPH